MVDQPDKPVLSSGRVGNVAKVAMRVKDIRKIVQFRGDCVRRPGAMAEPPFRATNSEPVVHAEVQESGDLYLVADFSFKAEGSDPKQDEPFVLVKARFLVVYELEPGPDLQAEDLEAFAHINGVLNLWPYWREFVHNSLTRADIPPFYMPPFNPAKMAQEAKRELEAGSSPS